MVKNVDEENEIPALKNPIKLCPNMGSTAKQGGKRSSGPRSHHD
jgi:hypothetical protein